MPAGVPVSTQELEENGISAHQASYLARHKWLTHLGRGVYLRPGEEPKQEESVAFLCKKISGLHVGGKTALSWRGIVHHIAYKEKLHLWGQKPVRIPNWFANHFKCDYQVTKLFNEKLPKDFGLQPAPNCSPDVKVSVPERALLELLSDVGKTVSLEEAGQITEALPSLRESVLDTFLTHCTRIKVIRLAYKLAEETDQPWKELALKHAKRAGGGERWQAVLRTGERLDLERP